MNGDRGAVPGESDPPPPDVLVVLVSYNSSGVLRRALAALPLALGSLDSVRVVVVDNDSSDGSADLVRHAAPWVQLIEAGANLGYAGGINTALRLCPFTRACIVLNPDAVPAPGSLALLVEGLAQDDTGITVPRIVDADGSLKYSLRREPTLLRAIGEGVLGGHRAARFSLLGDQVRDPDAYRDGAVADWATGAVMCFPRLVLDRVGVWDESFFLYSEETEFALRVRDAGWCLRLVDAAVVEHPGGDMEMSPRLWSLVVVNRVRLYRMRHGRAASWAYWSVNVLTEASRAALRRETRRHALRALLGGERRAAQLRLGGSRPARARRPPAVEGTQRPGPRVVVGRPDAQRGSLGERDGIDVALPPPQ